MMTKSDCVYSGQEAVMPVPDVSPVFGQWQPMATAPMDGRDVDLWLAPVDDVGAPLTPCRQPDAWFEAGGWWCWPSGAVGPLRINLRITHWMPLPAPPVSEDFDARAAGNEAEGGVNP